MSTNRGHTHHVGEVEVSTGRVVHSQSHDVGHRGIQERSLGGGQERDKDVGPREGEEECGGAVTDEHQSLVVCEGVSVWRVRIRL